MEEHKCEIICLYSADCVTKHSLRLHENFAAAVK